MKMQKYLHDLTPEELSILCGMALGDATIVKRSDAANSYRYRVAHGPNQLEYTRWLYEKLKRLSNPIHEYPAGSTNPTSYFFYLKADPWIGEIFHKFYKPVTASQNEEQLDTSVISDKEPALQKYRKSITQDLIDWLPVDPLLLAVWYMDDGTSRDDCFAGRLCTQGFYEPGELELLLKYLAKYKIQGNIAQHTVESGQRSISIGAEQFGFLVTKTYPYFKEVPSLLYKMNLERISKSKYFPDLLSELNDNPVTTEENDTIS